MPGLCCCLRELGQNRDDRGWYATFAGQTAPEIFVTRCYLPSIMTDRWLKHYQRAMIFALFLISVPASAWAGVPTPLGNWLTARGGAVVQIAACPAGNNIHRAPDMLCGWIVGIKLNRGSAMPRDYLGRSQCGFRLIRQAHPTGTPGVWHGHIVDPRNGHVFSASLRVTAEGQLALHGYLLLPVLGETQRWTRYSAPVPRSCRIVAG